MITLAPLLTIKSTLTLLLAPPGWGKTTGLISILNENNLNLVFLSPLNAINNEVYGRMGKLFKTFISSGDRKLQYKKFLSFDKSILISTPESLNLNLLELLNTKKKPISFVLDELHLFYHWSHSFRPILFEKLIEISLSQNPILGLTATLDKKIEDEITSGFSNQYENIIKIDVGNQKLLNYPTSQFSFNLLGKKFLFKYLLKKSARLLPGELILVFCAYRKQVEWWLDYSFYKGINAMGCVGGMTDQFLSQLSRNKDVSIIFSTTALSHGVNLPKLNSIWMLDKVENRDFYLQMVARGGRRGENFDLYSMDPKKEMNLFKQMIHSIKIVHKYLIGKL